MSAPALELRDLAVSYRVRGAALPVLRGVSLRVGKGESYGLVGESGCGKSTVALAVLRALPRNGAIAGGSVLIGGQDVTRLDPAGLRRLRSHSVSMVYQDAARALNPSLTIGRQLTEAYGLLGTHGDAARAAAEAMLGRVRIAGARRVMGAYPHQLSGGMQQRVVIAMALAKDPALLVLDEPTTGLDATVEAEVLDLLATLRDETGAALLFISHNLGIIRQMCDRVGVLYAGTLVEEGGAAGLLRRPIHPYTVQLLRCLPLAGSNKAHARLDTIAGFLPGPGPLPPGCTFAPRCALATAVCHTVAPPVAGEDGHWALCHHAGQPVPSPDAGARAPARRAGAGVAALSAVRLSKTYGIGANQVRAVRDVSLTLPAGQTLGLVGESGSGKTTLARLLLGLTPPDPGGAVELDGRTLPSAGRARADRKALQVVFQNPDSALNRAHTVRHLIGRALSRLAGLRGRALEARLAELLFAVRLTERHLPLRPRQLSGGLKQRVAIARAFAGNPRVVVCDEPTSALDVSVQASILNLLVDLQERQAVSYLFISHDLGVVRYISDRIAVMYLGRLMEAGPAEAVFAGPHHPYTEALLSAVPGFAGPRVRLSGDIPSPQAPPPGCVFSSRCPRKLGAICEQEEPPLHEQGDHAIRCHIPRPQLGRNATAEPAWSEA